MEATKRCQYCGEEILAVAIKCKHCGSALSPEAVTSQPIARKADYGWILLGIPLAGVLLIWGWVANMSLLQGPGNALTLILVAVVISTSAVAALELSKVGKLPRGANGPGQWGAFILLLWVIGYPAYLFNRRKYGLSNRLLPGLVVTALFLGSFAALYYAIDSKESEILSGLGDKAPVSNDLASEEKAADTPEETTSSSGSAPSRPVYKTTATDLERDYDANEVATDEKIGSSIIEISGTIDSIDKDFLGHVVLRLQTGDPSSSADMTLVDSEKDAASRLAQGQEIALQCTKMRRVVGSPSGDDCLLLPTGEAVQSNHDSEVSQDAAPPDATTPTSSSAIQATEAESPSAPPSGAVPTHEGAIQPTSSDTAPNGAVEATATSHSTASSAAPGSSAVSQTVVTPNVLASVRAVDPSAAEHIESYCTSATAGANDPNAAAAECMRSEADAWRSLVSGKEFEGLSPAMIQECSQPPWSAASYVAKEACAKYELHLD